jgi:hypothetical protein
MFAVELPMHLSWVALQRRWASVSLLIWHLSFSFSYKRFLMYSKAEKKRYLVAEKQKYEPGQIDYIAKSYTKRKQQLMTTDTLNSFVILLILSIILISKIIIAKDKKIVCFNISIYKVYQIKK